MARLVWAEPALEDLDETAEYIALDNVGAAKRLVSTVFEAIERLKDFPESGRKPPELQDARYREVVVGPCRVVYRHTSGRVQILHVQRAEQQLRTYILHDRAPGT